MHQNLVLDPFLILVNNLKQPLHAINSLKMRFILKEDYQKALKKVNFIFFSNLVPFNG